MEEQNNTCNPYTFYKNAVNEKKWSLSHDDLKVYGFTFLAVVVILSAPFLIIPPFFRTKLNTNSRKIVAMIVLSDAIASLSLAFILVGLDKPSDRDRSQLHACYYATVITNVAIACSLIWTCILFVYILFFVRHGQSQQSLPSTYLFVKMNLLAWPFGLLINSPRLYNSFKLPVINNGTYVFEFDCHLDYRFEEKGGACLLETPWRYILTSYYLLFLVLICVCWFCFVTTVVKAYKVYKTNVYWAAREESAYDVTSGYSVARINAYNVFKNSLYFIIPGAVYSIAYVPAFIYQIYKTTIGPVENGVDIFMALWLIVNGVMVAFMNILFYGVMSKRFREEMTAMFKSVHSCFCKKSQESNRRNLTTNEGTEDGSENSYTGSLEFQAVDYSNESISTMSDFEFD